MLSDTIFVFGSNKAGRHGKGAALHAVKHCGAKYSQGEGLQGRAYAIPTKDGKLNVLEPGEIKGYVDRFLSFASDNPEIRFQVTRVGCGLAGLKDEDIFPMFRGAPANCLLPGIWEAKRSGVQRLLIDGSRHFDNYDLLYEEADKAISAWGLKSLEVEIIHAVASGAPKMAERYHKERGLKHQSFKAEWNKLGRNAGSLCNIDMVWYSTHALVFQDGVSGEATHLLKAAKEHRLRRSEVLFTPNQKMVPRVAPKGIVDAQPDQAPSQSGV